MLAPPQKSDAPADNVLAFPDVRDVPIAEVFRLISGGELGDPDADEHRDYCYAHDDKTPSCDYNTPKNTWVCRSCGAGGGVLKLIVASGNATDEKAAIKWLRDKGLLAHKRANPWDTVSVVYQYTNAHDILVYEVGRWQLPDGKKEFQQRRPRPNGEPGYVSDMKNVERVPYRLPELLAAAADAGTIFVVEGEKDADRLRLLGLTATTNAQGAAWPWPAQWAEHFRGAVRVVVLGDNDEAGKAAAEHRASICALTVPDTRILLALPDVGEKGDVSDWLALGHTTEELLALADSAPTAEPYAVGYPEHAVRDLAEHQTDSGNGRWFTACVEGEYIWVADRGKWYAYADGIWSEKANTQAAAQAAVAKMAAAARDYSGPGADDFREWAEATDNVRPMAAMLEAAKAHLTRYSEIFDQHPHLLPVTNGTIDLHEPDPAKQLREHRAGDYITAKSAVVYDPEATCPNFEALLNDAMAKREDDGTVLLRPHLREYLELALGGTLEGRRSWRRCFFLFGPKGTRKSTLTWLLSKILGHFASSVSYNVLSETRFAGDGQGPSPATMKLRGKRLVVASEARENQRIDVALIKRLIGGDGISARGHHEAEQEFTFEATLIMTGNEVPRINADESFWQKFKPIPFENPLANEDPEYAERVLLPELPGILALLVRAHARLRAAGYRMTDPPEVAALCAAEQAAQNPVAEFFRQWIERDPGSEVTVEAMRAAYQRHCDTTAERRPLGNRSLANALKREPCALTQRRSNSTDYWQGIRLRDCARSDAAAQESEF